MLVARLGTHGPVSNLGVAAAVVAFIDFGSKLATKTLEVRSTAKGQPPNFVRLAALADDLTTVASAARDRAKNLISRYPCHAEPLERLTAECSVVEAKLKAGLNKLTANPTSNKLMSAASQLGVAIRSVWSAEEFKEWSHQPDNIRDQVTTNVLMDEIKGDRDDIKSATDGVKKTEDKAERILQIVGRIQVSTDVQKNNFEDGDTGGPLSETSRKARMEEEI
ncbi:hypothetical protein ACMFMG_004767 [Clarireedia jacksonii]